MNIVDSSAKSNMSISAFLISHLMREIVFRQQAGAGLALVHNQSVCTNILLVFVFPLYPFCISASKSSIQKFVITEKVPTRAFYWLKVATTAFTFKTLLRHYAKRALTPRSLNVKLGPRRKGHKGRAVWLA